MAEEPTEGSVLAPEIPGSSPGVSAQGYSLSPRVTPMAV